MKRGKYTFFWNGPFSQWYLSDFTIDGLKFNTCEQYMMFKKAITFNDAETANKILGTANPKYQKALGKEVKNFSSEVWDKVKQQIVFDGNYAKFTQNSYLKKLLLATQGTEMVEASPYDKVWGIGLREEDPRAMDEMYWQGENLLGIALNKVRYKIINEKSK